MRSRLWLRLTAVAVAVLALSLLVASLLAYELLLRSGRASLDDALRREGARLEAMLAVRAEEPGVTAATSPEQVAADVAEEYLRLFPDTEAYLTVTRIGDRVLTAPNAGPEGLEDLLAAGRLPAGTEDRIVTVSGEIGAVRTLTSAVRVGGTQVGTFQVAGPLAPVEDKAEAALRRLGAATAVSLVLGAGLIAAALRAGLRPLKGLSEAARTTEWDELSARVRYAGRHDELGVMAREFNRMLERLDAAAAARRELLASVSHELRTPITICLGHLEMLHRLRDQDPYALSQATSVVRDELLRLRVMVEDLMALARSEAGDFVSARPVRLQEFVDDLRFRVAGLQIDGVTLDEPPDVTIRADPERLAQAVLNLVLNGRAHTCPGTQIHVTVDADRDAVRFVVADDGRGIDPAIHDRAFEPFVRGPHAAPGGHGLGLAVVRAVAAAHGGQVHLDTGDGGTRITLVLPQAPSASPNPAATALRDARSAALTLDRRDVVPSHAREPRSKAR